MKIYITKYALTRGIIELDATISTTCPTMAIVGKGPYYSTPYHKPEWYLTLKEAKEHANELRRKKLLSLYKSIEKIKTLEF